MNINEFISYEDNNQPLFPLFKVELLKDAQIEDLPLNILFPRNNSILFDEDIIFKKIKGEENAIITAKKRGRKAIPKNTRQWNDPNITMKEIIENDLAGAPTEAEIKKNKERVKKIKETKARKKAEREKSTTAAATPIEKANDIFTLALEPLVDFPYAAPQIIFKDGKIIIAQEEEKKELVIVGDKKPYKLNSMSFRTKNHTAKWTLEETGKFYKAIEIFGTDFSLIAKLFPARNRNQIKNKFRKEEKANIKKIDEAINKNSGLAKKRSLMDRIRAFNNNVKTGEFAALANNEVNDELRGFDKLERRLSTASTDGMDLKIMEEIQDIFVKEIRPANNFAGNALGHLDLNLDFEKEDVNEAKNGMIEAGATQEFARIEEGNANKKQNLLLRLFN